MRVSLLFALCGALLLACFNGQLYCSAQAQYRTMLESAVHEVELVTDETSESVVSKEQPLKEFLAMPPLERVRLWKMGKSNNGLSNWDMSEALYVAGLDTVPYLDDIVRRDSSYNAVRAVELLCSMDRFVPDADLPLPEAGGDIYVSPLKIGGIFNYYMIVDGRRIGKKGVDAVMWAATQTEHGDLRFHARRESGLLEQDLSRLPLAEQLKQWRKAAVDSKGYLGMAGNADAHSMMFHLGILLVKMAPESIPPLLKMLESDRNSYVREGILDLLHLMDSNRVRLRSIEVGRRAIEAIKKALAEGNLKPLYNDRESADGTWDRWSAEFYRDDFYLHNSSKWALIALAFEKFYGEAATKRHSVIPTVKLIEAKPEMRHFITYLTNVDPFFPGWEYPLSGSNSQVLHPLFKQKIERYYQYWKLFKARARVER